MDKISFSGIALLTGNTLSDTTEQIYYRGTYGINTIYKNQLFSLRSSIYYQQNMNTKEEQTSAWCFSAFGEYQFVKKGYIGLGVDYLSGNDENATDLTNNQFDILYGRRHSWYGYMDYFSTIPAQGLQDYMVKLRCKPLSKLGLYIDWHYFLLSADRHDVFNATELISRKLGQEVDFKLSYEFFKESTFECGYSFYCLTETLKQIKTVDDDNLRFPQFYYFMVTLKPSMWINSHATDNESFL
jgi:hypothetical protein